MPFMMDKSCILRFLRATAVKTSVCHLLRQTMPLVEYHAEYVKKLTLLLITCLIPSTFLWLREFIALLISYLVLKSPLGYLNYFLLHYYWAFQWISCHHWHDRSFFNFQKSPLRVRGIFRYWTEMLIFASTV